MGGNYLDGRLRMRGYDSVNYFAVYRQDGEIVSTRFLAWDALAPVFLRSAFDDMERTCRQRLAYYWQHPEAD